MSADAGEQISLEAAFAEAPRKHEFDTDVIHDDRVLEPAVTCTHCTEDALQEGLCVRHLHEYRQDLCGDGGL